MTNNELIDKLANDAYIFSSGISKYPNTIVYHADIQQLKIVCESYHQAKCAESVPDGWISVNDRLPELIEGKQHSEKVMGIYRGENYSKETISCVATFALLAVDGDTKWIKVSNELSPVRQRDIADGYTEDVTHWMPLTLP